MSDLLPRSYPQDGNHPGENTVGGGGIQPNELLKGHFWRYEYFNYHDNATYFMNHYCMEDIFPQDKHGCGYDAPGQFDPEPHNTYDGTIMHNDILFTYSPLPNHDLHSWVIKKMQWDVDWMYYGRGSTWNMQKRRLGQDQGLIKMPKEYVNDKCSNYCEQELLLPIDPTTESHGELYNDVDDLCDRCR